MGLSCSIIPQVKNKDGKVVDSKLFTDIMKLTKKREVMLGIYERATSSFFLTENSDKLQFDENGEPTLNSLISNFDINELLEENIESSILKSLKEDGKTYANNHENTRILSEKASSFNTTSEYNNLFVALPILNSEGQLQLGIFKATEETRIEAEKMKANMMLNDRVKSILARNGLGIDALDALEEKLGTEGMVDFSVSEKSSDGLIKLIKLSRGIKGEQALPEEYAHFVIDSMSNDVFIKRSLSALENNDELIKEILGQDYSSYAEIYNHDQMVREALGKLLTLHLLNSVSTDGIAMKPIIDRLLNRIKEKYSSIDEKDIYDAMKEISASMEHIAHKVIDENTKFDLNLIKTKDILRHIDSAKAAVERIINTEYKRFDVYSKRLNEKSSIQSKTKIQNFKDRQIAIINKIKRSLNAGLYNQALLDYLTEMTITLDKLKTKLNDELSSTSTINQKAFVINEIQDYLDSYIPTLDNILDLSSQGDSSVTPEVKKILSEENTDVREFNKTVNRVSVELFADFLSTQTTENIRIEDSPITKEDLIKLLRESEKDISGIGLWLSSAASMNNIVIKLVDKAIKSKKDRTRRRVLALIDELNIVDQNLKKAGTKDYKFMYQDYPDGSSSPYYADEINYAAYYYNRKRVYDEANERYGKNPTGHDAIAKIKFINKFYKDNFDFDTNQPKASIYGNSLHFENEAQRQYYETFMRIRKEMIDLLPVDTYEKQPTQTIQIRKDFLDRLRSAPKEGWGDMITQQLKDMIQRRESDPSALYEYGFQDFRGREVMALPVFFTKRIDGPQSDVSRDATSSLIAFANMAIEYDELSKINDILETGRTVAEDTKFKKERFSKQLVERVRSLGETIETPIQKTETSNFAKEYNELLDTQMYGRYTKEGDDLFDGKINTKKTADTVNRLSSLNQLAINFIAGVAAVGTDSVNLAIEADSKRHFTRKNVFNADKIYFKNLLEMLSEWGSHIKRNKLSLFIRDFDLLHEYETDVRNGKYNKSRLGRILDGNILYTFMNIGAHFGEVRVALALADNTMLKDEHNNPISLWDAYETEDIDPENPDGGKRLKLKTGVKLSDGSVFNDEFKEFYKNSAWEINHRLFGIYNKADMNKLQKTALGCMAMLYRKYIVPSIQRRFGEEQYNAMLDEMDGGYYRIGLKAFMKMKEDLIDARTTLRVAWNNLSEYEKSQVRATASDILHIIAFWGISGLLLSNKLGDKKQPYFMRLLTLESKRVSTEITALSPFGLRGELLTILKSPAAGINTIESLIDLTDVLLPWKWTDEIQSGRFKGHSRAYKSFVKSPLMPMNNTIYRALHPEETIQFFNN